MMVVGLTGGIASGKSTVLSMLSDFFPTIDCDAIVDSLYRRKEVREKLTQTFGTASKKELAGIVFSSKQERKELEGILHPLVKRELKERLKGLEQRGSMVAVVEVPLLFESSLEKEFDKVVVVHCSKAQQLERMQKQGLSLGESKERLKSQMPLGEKTKKADFVVDNSAGLEETREQVKNLVDWVGGFVG